MLVKLGSVWFCAAKVERIMASRPPKGLITGADGSEAKPVPDGKNAHYVSVRTFNCSDTTVIYTDTLEEAEKLADEYAGMTNASINV